MDRVQQVAWIRQLAADTFDNSQATYEDYGVHGYGLDTYVQDLKGEAEAQLRARPWYSKHDEQVLYAALYKLACPANQVES